MNDKKLIITGVIIFVFILIFPFLYNLGGTTEFIDPVLSEKAKAAKFCVVPKEDMKVEHMQILDVWRDTVVRKGERVYVNSDGKKFTMSLSTGENSCLGCHNNKAEFCDRCHDYASVRPYCWDCHTDPKEIK